MPANDIKRIRTKLGLTQEQFAELFGLASKASVSNIETGFRNANNAILLLLGHLDSLPKASADKLVVQLFKQARKVRCPKGATQ